MDLFSFSPHPSAAAPAPLSYSGTHCGGSSQDVWPPLGFQARVYLVTKARGIGFFSFFGCARALRGPSSGADLRVHAA